MAGEKERLLGMASCGNVRCGKGSVLSCRECENGSAACQQSDDQPALKLLLIAQILPYGSRFRYAARIRLCADLLDHRCDLTQRCEEPLRSARLAEAFDVAPQIFNPGPNSFELHLAARGCLDEVSEATGAPDFHAAAKNLVKQLRCIGIALFTQSGKTCDVFFEIGEFNSAVRASPREIVSHGAAGGILRGVEDILMRNSGQGQAARNSYREHTESVVAERYIPGQETFPLLDRDPADLPGRARIKELTFQLFRRVKGIDNEEWPFVTDGHVDAILLRRENHGIAGKV